MPPAEQRSPLVTVNLQDRFEFNSSRSPKLQPEDYQIPESVWAFWFATWLQALAADLHDRQVYELSLRLSDDREMQTLNARYRNLDRPTDVLAFAALETEIPSANLNYSLSEPLYLGDIIISVDTASKQAELQQHSLKKEIVWLAVHGFLHLLGWDHPDESSLAKMIAQQETLLQIDSLKITELTDLAD